MEGALEAARDAGLDMRVGLKSAPYFLVMYLEDIVS